MQVHTHERIDRSLCGAPRALSDGRCTLVLELSEVMCADDSGLVHGGFLFGAADYAAMLAVNHPNVVLASAEVKFLAPSVLGDLLTFEAAVRRSERNKRWVEVTATSPAGKQCFIGSFLCVVPDKHVLDPA